VLRKSLAAPAACFASGAVLALCLPRPGLCLLAWVAPAVLLWNLERAPDAKRAALLGGAFGFAFCALSLNWIFFTCRFAGVPLPISFLALFCLSFVLCLAWALFGSLAWFCAQRLPDRTLPGVWALLWTGIESAGAHWTPRVGVDLLAYTQWRYLAMIQVGALFGPHFLGFLIMLWNGALARVLSAPPGDWIPDRGSPARIPAFRWLAAAGSLVIVCILFGAARLAARGPDPSGGAMVSIIQPNIDQYQKWDSAHERSIRAAFDTLMGSGKPDPSPGLWVWPESSLPGWLDEPENRDWVGRWAMRAGRELVVGTVSRSGLRSHNSAAWFGTDGEPRGLYHKRRLVPFGEFVPLRSWLEGWIGILAQMGDLDPGAKRQPLWETALGRTAVNICYEAVFPHLLRLDSARGARVFLNLTNDGWYKDTWGPYQHFMTNRFRAVENRATVIRAANTGISGIFDPYGVLLGRTPLGEPARLDAVLGKAGRRFPRGSLFSRTGDVFGLTCLLLGAASLAWAFRRKTGDKASRIS